MVFITIKSDYNSEEEYISTDEEDVLKLADMDDLNNYFVSQQIRLRNRNCIGYRIFNGDVVKTEGAVPGYEVEGTLLRQVTICIGEEPQLYNGEVDEEDHVLYNHIKQKLQIDNITDDVVIPIHEMLNDTASLEGDFFRYLANAIQEEFSNGSGRVLCQWMCIKLLHIPLEFHSAIFQTKAVDNVRILHNKALENVDILPPADAVPNLMVDIGVPHKSKDTRKLDYCAYYYPDERRHPQKIFPIVAFEVKSDDSQLAYAFWQTLSVTAVYSHLRNSNSRKGLIVLTPTKFYLGIYVPELKEQIIDISCYEIVRNGLFVPGALFKFYYDYRVGMQRPVWQE